MTKEEIIDNLNYQNKKFYGGQSETLKEAIKALEIVEEFEKAQIITGGRLNGRTYAYKCGLEDGKRKALEQQPSNEDVQRVVDYLLKPISKSTTSEDCVSRQAAIDMAKSYNTDGYDSYTPLVVDVEDIEELPPVTPTRKVGKWIYKKLGVRTFGIVCSSCNRVYHEGQNIGSLEEFKKDIERIMRERNVTLDEYCCHCGTEMVGAENERV